MHLGAAAKRHLSELKGTFDAKTDGDGPPVAAILFPVGDDVGGSADGGHLVQAVVDEVLQVHHVDVVAVIIARV